MFCNGTQASILSSATFSILVLYNTSCCSTALNLFLLTIYHIIPRGTLLLINIHSHYFPHKYAALPQCTREYRHTHTHNTILPLCHTQLPHLYYSSSTQVWYTVSQTLIILTLHIYLPLMHTLIPTPHDLPYCTLLSGTVSLMNYLPIQYTQLYIQYL